MFRDTDKFRIGGESHLSERWRRLNARRNWERCAVAKSFCGGEFATSSFFFTVAAVRLDRSCRSLQFAGAGHPPAMIARRGNCQGCSNRGAGSSGCSKMSWTLRNHRNSHRTGDRVLIYTMDLQRISTSSGKCWGSKVSRRSCAMLRTCPCQR